MNAFTNAARRGRFVGAGDERGAALISTLLFMVMLTGLSFLLLSVLLGQIAPAIAAQKSTRTVYGAQAGLQAGLGLIRSVAGEPDPTGHVYGDLSALPCEFDGRVDGNDDALNYGVVISYFVEDPTGTSAAWRAANDLDCREGAGVADQPEFALVVSEGQATTDAAGTVGERRLEATYQFKVTNKNVPGARIFTPDGSQCLQVDGQKKAAGPEGSGGPPAKGPQKEKYEKVDREIRYVDLQYCDNDELQLWTYGSDYQIKLASTTVDGRTPLCITDMLRGKKRSDTRAQPCLTGADRWPQLWSWVGGETWKGQLNPISAGTSERCLAPEPANNGRLEVNDKGCEGSFKPEAGVGAGGAGYATGQIVNYKEFGRCADVTNENINSDFMITYPCKQDPTKTGAYLLWNHKWFYSEPPTGQSELANQEIFIRLHDNDKDRYCLQTKDKNDSSRDVSFKKCDNSSLQRWTRYSDTGDYASSYLFIDSYGRCLEADSTDTYSGVASKMKAKTCNGSESQKWNAPANANDAKFGGYKETSG